MHDLELISEGMSLTSLSNDTTTSADALTPRSASPDIAASESNEESLDQTPENTELEAKSTWSEQGNNDEPAPLETIQPRLDRVWSTRHRTSRYKNVVAFLIQWEEHDLGDELDESTHRYDWMFRNLYKYEVWCFKIPSKKPHLAVMRQLAALAERDGPETLFIIWYDGHGFEHPDRRGPPEWSSHRDPEQAKVVQSGIISNALSDCEADILLVNNACNSLTCDRFIGTGIVESISASAFNTFTYGSIRNDDLSPSMTWAAHQILSDKRSVEEGITVAELHRRICLGTQWAASDHVPNWNGPDGNIINWDEKSGRTQPVYTRLSADAAGPGGRTRSIVLRRLEEPKDVWIGYDDKKVQLELRLCNYDEINPDEWVEWILMAPSCVQNALLTTKDNIEKEEEPEAPAFDNSAWN